MQLVNKNWSMIRNVLTKTRIKDAGQRVWLRFWNSRVKTESAHSLRYHNGTVPSDKPSGLIVSWGDACKFPSSGISVGLVGKELEDEQWTYPPIITSSGLSYMGAGLEPAYNITGTMDFGGRVDWESAKRPIRSYLRDCANITSKYKNYHILVNVKNVGVSLYKLCRNSHGYALFKNKSRKEWKTQELVEITRRWIPDRGVLLGPLVSLLCNEKWDLIIIDDERYATLIRSVVEQFGLYIDVKVMTGYEQVASPSAFEGVAGALAKGRGIYLAEAACLCTPEMMHELLTMYYEEINSIDSERILVMSLNNKYWAGALADALYMDDQVATLPVTIFNIPENN
ncbi:hypothetical protein NVP1031O_042 [Vibrio phage 1.031.O._10N.261.46.F8]|nr:hypothetical protein NVP1031O_042 [Vibrio phage 1.031.O._10N.261.46.F8]